MEEEIRKKISLYKRFVDSSLVPDGAKGYIYDMIGFLNYILKELEIAEHNKGGPENVADVPDV